jgi:integrase
MPNERPPKTPNERPLRGLSFEYRPHLAAPFLARWREGGVKKYKAFGDAEARDTWAGKWAEMRRQNGMKLAVRNADEDAAMKEFRRITKDADLLDVARFWAKHHSALDGAIPLGKAIAQYIAAQSDRKLSRDTVTHRDLHLKRLRESLGEGTPVRDVTADRLREWLAGLKMSAYSVKHHRGNVHKLFEWLIVERLAERNPCLAIPIPDLQEDEVTVLTLAQAQKLFEANRHHRSVARMAIEAFAGLRFSSAARLVKEDIKIEQRGIEMPGYKHKTGRRQFIDGLPDNLWDWIALATDRTWAVSARLYADDKRTMFEAAGLRGEKMDNEATRNALRHSFASNHVAAFRDPGRTALILTHRNQQMLWRHYKGRATEADGKAYFEIRPEAI